MTACYQLFAVDGLVDYPSYELTDNGCRQFADRLCVDMIPRLDSVSSNVVGYTKCKK